MLRNLLRPHREFMRIRSPSFRMFRRRRFIDPVVALSTLAVACSATATPIPEPNATPVSTPTVAPRDPATANPLPVATDTSALDGATEEAFAVLEGLLEELGPRESTTE